MIEFKDLEPARDLKRVFKTINNRVSADSTLAKKEKQGAEVIRLIMCKLKDETQGRTGKATPAFQLGEGLRSRINELWSQCMRTHCDHDANEVVACSDATLELVVSELQDISLLDTDADAAGDAFEMFADRQFAGGSGQFFTPRAVVKMMVDIIGIKPGDTVLDPACGSGGFISYAARFTDKVHGLDKDVDLARICRTRLSMLSNECKVMQVDSLSKEALAVAAGWTDGGLFDAVLANPPFGTTLKIANKEILQSFQLGREWHNGKPRESANAIKARPPQTLFVERCIMLTRPGGYTGLVLPDGLLGNPSDSFIRTFISMHAEVIAVIDCPTTTFQPHTGAKTTVVIMQRKPIEWEGKTFMAVAEHCGHTHRGEPVSQNDFPIIAKNYNNAPGTKLGFMVDYKPGSVLIPKFYAPTDEFDGVGLRAWPIKRLVELGVIMLGSVGACPKSSEYDSAGQVRFVKTSDVNDFKIRDATQTNVNYAVYEKYKRKQNVCMDDIIFVKDGGGRVGECAIVTDHKITLQSHFYKFRPMRIDPYLLLWALNTPAVKQQIRQRVFSQSTLSTIGSRIMDIELNLPESKNERRRIANEMRELFLEKQRIEQRIKTMMNNLGLE